MENLEWILSLAVTALSLFAASVSFLIKLIKNIKDKIQVKNYNERMESVAPIMEIAENHTKYKGEDKKKYVLEKVNLYAEENGLKFYAKNVADKIEELVEFSKKVNKRI